VYVFVFFIVLNNLHRQETIQLVSLTLIFLAMAISFYAIFQFFTNSDRVWHVLKPYPRRGSGTYVCPNHLGGFLEMGLPLALAFTIAGRLKPVIRILVAYSAAVILGGILVTMSRGTWVATGFVVVLFFALLIFHPGYRFVALITMAILLASGIYILPKSYA